MTPKPALESTATAPAPTDTPNPSGGLIVARVPPPAGMQCSASITKIASALATAQGEIAPASKSAQNPHFGSNYADLASVMDACRAALAKAQVAVVGTIEQVAAGSSVLRTTLIHSSGEWISSLCPLVVEGRGGMQGLGSAITYARRYALAALVGIVADEDDDGHAATGKAAAARAPVIPMPRQPRATPLPPLPTPTPLASPEQVARINELVELLGPEKLDPAAMLKHYAVSGIALLNAVQAGAVIATGEKRLAQQAAA